MRLDPQCLQWHPRSSIEAWDRLIDAIDELVEDEGDKDILLQLIEQHRIAVAKAEQRTLKFDITRGIHA